MNHELKITDQQRTNLAKLADYLEALPEDYSHFDMAIYAAHDGEHSLAETLDEDGVAAKRPKTFFNDCGTVACAAGHGPAAGVKPLKNEFVAYYNYTKGCDMLTFNWHQYTERAFGATNYLGIYARALYGFLFSGGWQSYDNHHWGAAARIRYVLAEGVPPSELDFYDTERYAAYRKQPASV